MQYSSEVRSLLGAEFHLIVKYVAVRLSELLESTSSMQFTLGIVLARPLRRNAFGRTSEITLTFSPSI